MRQLVYDKEQLRRAKILQSEDLKELVRMLEAGNVIIRPIQTGTIAGCFLASLEHEVFQSVPLRRLRTLIDAGVVREHNSDDEVHQWVLTYDPDTVSIDDYDK